MKNANLNKIVDLIINEEMDEAKILLSQWFLNQNKAVYESLMQDEYGSYNSDDRTKDIKNDQKEIESEEYFGEDDNSNDTEEDDLNSEHEADSEVEDGTDSEEELDNSEENDSEDDSLKDQVVDLQSEMERLKAEFDKLISGEDHDDLDSDEKPEEDSYKFSDDFGGDSDDSHDDSRDDSHDDSYGDTEEDDNHYNEDEDSDDSMDDLDESLLDIDDFLNLDEGFDLELVKDVEKTSNKEVGSNGKRLDINNKSIGLQPKASDRLKGDPVVIKSVDHRGFDREKSPEVKQINMQSKNSFNHLGTVSKDGDRSALLNNKADGFGKDSPKSPVAQRKSTI